MTVNEVMQKLEEFGNENTKKTLMRHGAKEPFFGVKVGDLKKIVKKVKNDHDLSLDLYKTGNSDAMYLAGLIADEKKITKEDLNEWLEGAYWHYLSEYTVPWIAADSAHGWDLGLQWIQSDEEKVAAAGWSTLSNVAGITPDEELDIAKLSSLLDEVGSTIHDAKNRVRYTMNQFVIAMGGFVVPLNEKAKEVALKIGKVSVNVGDTSCKVPLAEPYIEKMEKMGRIGRKKKMARC